MEFQQLTLVEELIRDYSLVRGQHLDFSEEKVDSILSDYLHSKYQFEQRFSAITNDLINQFVAIQNANNALRRSTSYSLNVFKQFRFTETSHSYILADLLNPNGSHGQGHLFLNLFLDELGIKRLGDVENWIVTAEKGRVDVLLKRVDPHSVVIIENKSNNAIDQENQLYRYWHQEVYKTIIRKNLPPDYVLNPPKEFYQLIYLTPSDWKKPSENSLERPRDYNMNLPKMVPMKPNLLAFDRFVVSWLIECLAKVNSRNHRLREYLFQYIEFWTE